MYDDDIDDNDNDDDDNAAAAAAAASAAAADAYAAYDAKTENQKETADICRKYLPIEVWNINVNGELIK